MKRFVQFDDLFEVRCKKCGSNDVSFGVVDCERCGSEKEGECYKCGSKFKYHDFKEIEVAEK
jgi:hypothetical protein